VGINLCYSVPPFRIKRFPFIDLAVGPASYLIPALAGFVALTHAWPTLLMLLAGVLFFLGLDLMFKTLDLEADAQANLRGTAVVVGRPYALIASAAFIALSGWVASMLILHWQLGILPYLIIVAMLYKNQSAQERLRIDRHLPYWYMAAGFLVTCGLIAFG
jgi:4-hydroxybenzoate polyprenyltransferase